ncbi:MAG: hypothetical protein LHV68_07285 [Elusimicrobia bacterium]|nr:hypothetical protein [Candidatus Liberimonas magnetica]
MSLKQLLDQNRIIHHTTSKQEISNLFELIRRDLNDAKIIQLSADRRFATAYNAALQLGTILLYCKGYKTKGIGHHFIIFQAMKEILDKEHHSLADYFDSCRTKRNISDYTGAGNVSDAEVDEIIKEVESFYDFVISWIKKNYPGLIK